MNLHTGRPSQLSHICVGVSGNNMNIFWDPHPCNVTGYIIQYNHTSTGNAKTIITSGIVPRGVYCHQELGGPYQCLVPTGGHLLNISWQYSYQVAATSIYGAGPLSEPVYAKGIDFVDNESLSRLF